MSKIEVINDRFARPIFSDKGLFIGSSDPTDFDTVAVVAALNLFYAEAILQLIANTAGAAGNAINLTIVDDVTSGSEFATITGGTDITLHVEAGVTSVNTAFNTLNSTPAVFAVVLSGNAGDFGIIDAAGGPFFLSGGIDATTPDENLYVKTSIQLGDISAAQPAAMLHLESTTQGVLFPDASAVVDPPFGLIRHQGLTLQLWSGSSWISLLNANDAASYILQGGNGFGVPTRIGSQDNFSTQIDFNAGHRVTFAFDNPGGQVTEIIAAGNYPDPGENTNLLLTANTSSGGHGGIWIQGGNVSGASGSGGRILLRTGNSGASGGDAGSFELQVGDNLAGTGTGGHFNLLCGSGDIGGHIQMYAGGGATGGGGDINISCGNGADQGGQLTLYAGNGGTTFGGHVFIGAGTTTDGQGGNINLYVGSSVNSTHGAFQYTLDSTCFEQKKLRSVDTTDATVTTLDTFPTQTDSMYDLEIVVTSRRTGGTAGAANDAATYKINARIKNDGGTVTIIDEIKVSSEDQAAWDAEISVDTTDILLEVTGAVDNNITWKSVSKLYGEFIVL